MVDQIHDQGLRLRFQRDNEWNPSSHLVSVERYVILPCECPKLIMGGVLSDTLGVTSGTLR